MATKYDAQLLAQGLVPASREWRLAYNHLYGADRKATADALGLKATDSIKGVTKNAVTANATTTTRTSAPKAERGSYMVTRNGDTLTVQYGQSLTVEYGITSNSWALSDVGIPFADADGMAAAARAFAQISAMGIGLADPAALLGKINATCDRYVQDARTNKAVKVVDLPALPSWKATISGADVFGWGADETAAKADVVKFLMAQVSAAVAASDYAAGMLAMSGLKAWQDSGASVERVSDRQIVPTIEELLTITPVIEPENAFRDLSANLRKNEELAKAEKAAAA